MRFRTIIRIGWVLPVFFLGCVSTSQFNAVSNDFHLAQQEITDAQKKIDELNYVLRNAEEDTEHCRKAQARLQDKIIISDNDKKQISQQIEELNHTVNKQATLINKQTNIISIQEAVIRMLDDPQQTIQTSIKEQIAAQNLEASTSSSPIKSGSPNESVH